MWLLQERVFTIKFISGLLFTHCWSRFCVSLWWSPRLLLGTPLSICMSLLLNLSGSNLLATSPAPFFTCLASKLSLLLWHFGSAMCKPWHRYSTQLLLVWQMYSCSLECMQWCVYIALIWVIRLSTNTWCDPHSAKPRLSTKQYTLLHYQNLKVTGHKGWSLI